MNIAERSAALSAKGEAERAAWPDRYPVVKRMMALGFEPWAYGNIDDFEKRDLLDPDYPMSRPPTQFGYGAGGWLYPDHSQGAAHGAIFSIYSHERVEYEGPGNLDGGPEQPACPPHVRREWRAGKLGYGATKLALDQAARLLIAQAAHHRQHYIVPEWVSAPHRFRKLPELTAAEWRELAALPKPGEPPAQPAAAQMALFAVEPVEANDRWSQQARELSGVAAGHSDDERIAHDFIGINDLVQYANDARAPKVPPVPTLDEVLA